MAGDSVSYVSSSVGVLTVQSWMYVYVNMFLVVMWSSCYYSPPVKGQHQVIGSQPVLARVGDEVILSCHFVPPDDMQKKTVEWSRHDLTPRFVFLLQDGRNITRVQNLLYEHRTFLFHEELSHGNISLKLSRVTLSDEGNYTCLVPKMNSRLIQLLVGNVTQPNISSKYGGLMLTCDSGCWYPKPEMSWLDSDGNNITAGPPKKNRPSPHCYVIQSNVTVTHAAKKLTCRVHLPHINYTADEPYTISDGEKADQKEKLPPDYTWIKIVLIIIVCIIFVVAIVGAVYWKKIQKALRGCFSWKKTQTKGKPVPELAELMEVLFPDAADPEEGAIPGQDPDPKTYEQDAADPEEGAIPGQDPDPKTYEQGALTGAVTGVRQRLAPATHFVDQHRSVLINRVKMVGPILDLLLYERGITQEGYDNVRSKTTTQEQMRELYTLLNSRTAKDLFYKVLEKLCLLHDLGHFVDQHRQFLIQNVKSFYPILDLLLEEGAITREGYDNVRSNATTQDQMRYLYQLLNSSKAKDLFYKGLEEHEKFLLDKLK